MNIRSQSQNFSLVSTRALNMLTDISINDSVRSLSLAEVVAHRLKSAMSIGILSEGDRLPPESVLAEYMGVSPLILRHGLNTLRQQGLVGTKRGRHGGSFVSGNVEIRDQDIDARLREMSTDDLRDLYDQAAVVASGAARLGALRADKQDIDRMRFHNSQVLQAQSGSALRRAIGRLHIGLGVAAQSKRLTAQLVKIEVELAPISWREIQVENRRQEIFTENESVITAIEQRDPLSAVAQMLSTFESEQIHAIKRHLELIASEAGEVNERTSP